MKSLDTTNDFALQSLQKNQTQVILTLCLVFMIAFLLIYFPVISIYFFPILISIFIVRFSWLMWLVIALFPFQFLPIGLENILYKISYYDVILLLLVIKFAWKMVLRHIKFHDRQLLYILSLFYLVCVLSIIKAGLRIESIYFLLRFAALLVTFLLLVDCVRERPLGWWLSALLMSLLILIIGAINEVLHSPAKVELLSIEGQVRFGSIYHQPNETAHAIAVFLPMIVGFTFFPKIRRVIHSLLMVTAVFMGLILVLSESRGGLISATAGLIILTLYTRKFSLFLMVILLGISLAYSPGWIEKLATIRQRSAISRVELIEYGFKSIIEHPFLGIGVRKFRELGEYTFMPLEIMGRAPHNLYLRLAVETGILGLVAFLAFPSYIWRKISKFKEQKRKSNRLIKGIALSSFVSVFCSYFFTGGILFFPKWISLAIAIGLTEQFFSFDLKNQKVSVQK